ncbi:MAG: hypothetical protein OEQ49_13315 [Myxococcales bacterium]|nr:hypothetical protein [Myxococcales bacterium]
MTDVVAMGLALPEVQELLERTEGIYESNRLANPNAVAPPFSSSDAHRIGAWHSWVQLSWMQEAVHAPSSVAFKIARVMPGARIRIKTTGGTMPIDVTRQVRARPDGTAAVRAIVRGDPPGLFGLLAPLMRLLVQSSVRRDYLRLKSILEADG